MGIDWSQIAHQLGLELPQLITHIIGFAITVWLLKKYAWGPLLGLLEERRNKIVSEFDEIEKEKAGVADLSAEYEAKLKDIDNERRAKIVEAVEEGKQLAAEVKANAQAEVKEFHEKAKAELEREVAKAKVQLRNDMIAMSMTAAEKFIGKKLDNDEHRRLIGDFIDGLEKA
jgi:F-type H+-transporting ATPase subunit b